MAGPPSPWSALAVDKHLVVRVIRALHDDAAKLDDDILRSQRAGYAKLEDARVRIGEPVVLDQVFRHNVRGQHGRAGAWRAAVGKRPLRNQWKLACLRGQRLYGEAGRDLARVEHDVELALHLAIDQVQQNRIGVDRGRVVERDPANR